MHWYSIILRQPSADKTHPDRLGHADCAHSWQDLKREGARSLKGDERLRVEMEPDPSDPRFKIRGSILGA